MIVPKIEILLARFAQRRQVGLAYLLALIVTAGAIGARAALQPILPAAVVGAAS